MENKKFCIVNIKNWKVVFQWYFKNKNECKKKSWFFKKWNDWEKNINV